MASMLSYLQPMYVELMLCAVALLLLMKGVYGQNQTASRIAGYSFIALAAGVFLTMQDVSSHVVLFGGMFASDPFIRTMKLLILIAAGLVMLLTIDEQKRQETQKFEFPVLMLLAVIGMLLMVSAADLMALYMGLELMSLSLYVLAAFRRGDARATEAGLKYFILGALASGMLLYGCSLVYGFTGTTQFDMLADYFNNAGEHLPVGATIGLVMVMIGLCFKVSAVPFHMWAPDVYEGVPTIVTAFFASAPKIAGLTLFIRVLMEPFVGLASQWQQIIVIVSILSMIVGAFAALRQQNIKRLLAYSSIGHVGYALIGLAAANQDGIRGIIIYLALYLLMSVGSFTCVLLMRRNGNQVEQISDLSGLHRTHPRMALALAIFMFSMAGIPPLAGFFGKMYIFLAAVEAGMYTLAVIGVLTSVVAAYYYLRVVKVLYLEDVDAPLDQDTGKWSRIVMAVSAGVTAFYFLYPAPLVKWAGDAANALML